MNDTCCLRKQLKTRCVSLFVKLCAAGERREYGVHFEAVAVGKPVNDCKSSSSRGPNWSASPLHSYQLSQLVVEMVQRRAA